MATEDTANLDSNDPEVRLSQFLYVGKEYPDYQPGNWFVHNYFMAKNVRSIEELAENPEKELLPTQLILKAYESKLVPNPEVLVFALAVCCRQMKSESLRHAAYTMLEKICVSPQHFILFIKFASTLSKQKELDQSNNGKNGWGHGLRKAVNNWYLSKDPLELAKCVTRYRGRYGWKHKDIIKLSHPQANASPEKEAVLKYIIRGLEETKKTYGEDPKCTEIIKYIETVEDFKHCEDEVRAAGLLEMYNFTLDHVPGHLLKSKEVWNSLIPSMDLVLLLNNLQRIHNLELLTPQSSTVDKIIDQITNEESIARDKVHPALVLTTLRNYENSGKPFSYEKRKIKAEAKKPWPLPLEPNVNIVYALYKTLNLSFSHLKPTGLRYMVTISMSKAMLKTRAWHSGNVYGAEVGCIIALSLLRCEKNVTVATFKNVGFQTASINQSASFNDAMRQLRGLPSGNVHLDRPMTWANHQNNKYDVFINVVEQITEKSDTSGSALAAYKNEMKLPNTKLINCAVCCTSSYPKKNREKDILTISGFDPSVPSIIQAFATSLF